MAVRSPFPSCHHIPSSQLQVAIARRESDLCSSDEWQPDVLDDPLASRCMRRVAESHTARKEPHRRIKAKDHGEFRSATPQQ